MNKEIKISIKILKKKKPAKEMAIIKQEKKQS